MKTYMNRILCLALMVLMLPVWNASAQKSYVIGFYNLENLFDTYHDEGKNDYEYLPDGANEWTAEKYAVKLRNMARVIADMAKGDSGDEERQRRVACRSGHL